MLGYLCQESQVKSIPADQSHTNPAGRPGPPFRSFWGRPFPRGRHRLSPAAEVSGLELDAWKSRFFKNSPWVFLDLFTFYSVFFPSHVL